MDLEDTKVSEKGKNTSDKNVFLLITFGIIIFILIIAIVLVIIFKNQHKGVTGYTNPFAPQAQQKTSSNPFAGPTTAYQNPFTPQNQQTTNNQYQNPFSGGQQ